MLIPELVRRGRTFWGPTRQLAAWAIRADRRLSAEAVRNEWAARRIEISGPASSGPDCLPSGRSAPGSNAAARIVECTPRRHVPSGAAGTKAADESASVRKISPPPAATGGLIAVPLDPLLASLCSRK